MKSKININSTQKSGNDKYSYKTYLYFLIILSISFFIQGCGNNSNNEFIIKANEDNTLALGKNFKVEIPNGSLDQNYNCTISKNADEELPVISGFTVYGDVYSIQHDGIVLNKKADIKIKLDTVYIEGKHQIARYSEKSIEILDTSFKDGYLNAQTSTFSSFFIYTKNIFDFEKSEINNKQASDINRKQKFYLAKVKNNESINIYKNSFHYMETKIIGSIKLNEKFRAYVGIDNGEVRKIITDSGIIGFVESSKIEIVKNYDNFNEVKSISNFEILNENILLQRLKEDKPNLKSIINSNYLINYKTAKKNNKNFILIELSSKNSNNYIEAHRGGFGLILSNKLNIDQDNIEVNYYNKKRQYIDAIELSTEYEDYYYEILKDFSSAITGNAIDFDKVKTFMEFAGVGEIETPINKDILTSSSPDNQFIGKYFGSYQHANSYLYPRASTLQIAIPVNNSLVSINEILNENEIKLLLGTYLNNEIGRTTLIKNIKKEIRKCSTNSFEGEFSNDKALSVIYNKYENLGSSFLWNQSKFKNNSEFNRYIHKSGFFKSQIDNLLKINDAAKILIIKNISEEMFAPSDGILYSIFLFTKCKNGWMMTNYMNEIFSIYTSSFESIDIGERIGLKIILGGGNHGYYNERTVIYIPTNNNFKEVFEIQSSENTGGNYEIGSPEAWSYKTTITSNQSDRELYDLIIHKKGSMRNDNYKIVNVDERNIYQFDGNKYVLSNTNNTESEDESSSITPDISSDQVVIDYYKWDKNKSIKVYDIQTQNIVNIDKYINLLEETDWFSNNYLTNLKNMYNRYDNWLRTGQIDITQYGLINDIYFSQDMVFAVIIQDPVKDGKKATVVVKQCGSPGRTAKDPYEKTYIGKDYDCDSYYNDIVYKLIIQNNKWVIDDIENQTNSFKHTENALGEVETDRKNNYIGISSSSSNDETTTMTDIDGNVYKTMKIGDQWWMAENFKGTKQADGTAIPNVTRNIDWHNLSITDAAYCFYNNDDNNQYGALYTWDAAVKAAPSGWHLPTDEEWKQLEMHLGMSRTEADKGKYRGSNEASMLAGNSDLWQNGVLKNNSAFGTSAFNALPGGYRTYTDGTFHSLSYKVEFWSITNNVNNKGAWVRLLYHDNLKVDREYDNRRIGYSVRYIKDN